MFSTFLKIEQINFASNVNMWIYYLRKLPLIKKIIPETLYNATDVKTSLGYVVLIFSIIFNFLKKFAYIFIMIILPSMLITKYTKMDTKIVNFHIFFFLSFIIGPLVDNKFTGNFKKDFYMINLMRIDAKNYFLIEIFSSYIISFIFFIIPVLFLGCNLFQALVLVCELVAIHSICQYLYLLVFKYKKIHLTNKVWFVIPLIFIPLVCAFGLPLLNIVFNFKSLYLNPIFIATFLILSIISIRKLLSYKEYTLLAKSVLSKFTLDELNATVTDSMFMDVKLNEKKISSQDLINDKHYNKTGLQYLNAKFIERHNNSIVTPIKRRTIIIAIVCITLALIAYFIPNSRSTFSKVILNGSGIAVFILYCLSLGERFTRAFFFNCDVSLLRYKFYRDPKIIISNFRSRLKLTIFFNLIPALCLAIGLTIILIISKGNLIEFIPIFISILTLSCFFSIHYLLLYYIVQPYTSQLTIKSPIYRAASFIVYIIAYTCLQINNASLLFTLAVIAITVLYTIISLIAVYKYAPKNFKLK